MTDNLAVLDDTIDETIDVLEAPPTDVPIDAEGVAAGSAIDAVTIMVLDGFTLTRRWRGEGRTTLISY